MHVQVPSYSSRDSASDNLHSFHYAISKMMDYFFKTLKFSGTSTVIHTYLFFIIARKKFICDGRLVYMDCKRDSSVVLCIRKPFKYLRNLLA